MKQPEKFKGVRHFLEMSFYLAIALFWFKQGSLFGYIAVGMFLLMNTLIHIKALRK